MLSEKAIEAVEETAAELNRRRSHNPATAEGSTEPAKRREANPDQLWAKKNLRFRDGRPLLDIANMMRIFERHEEYKGRFRYNETLNKVLDKGSLMLDWRIMEVCADVQERFLPEVPETVVRNALIVMGNRNGISK